MILFLVLSLSIPLLFLFLKNRKTRSKQPPGPPRLPLIGNLHQFASSTPHLRLHLLSKTYGPLMSLKLGSIPTLVVSSAEMAKEVMKTQDQFFCGRPSLATQQKLLYNGLDVAFAPFGDYWRAARKLCVLHLFSSKKVLSFSSVREDGVYRMVQQISRLSAEGKAVNLSEMTIELTISVICRIAFGRISDGHNTRSRRGFEVVMMDAMELLICFFFSDYFPGMGWVDQLTGKSSRLHRVFVELDSFYEEIIEEHREGTHVPIDESGDEDIVDVLLKHQRDKSLGIDITTDHIKGILSDVFLGATESSAAIIVWVMTELMRNPKAMKRVQEEARTLMGDEPKDMIQGKGFEKLVYLRAVIKETLRLHPTSPLLVPRETTEKCTIEGYEIEAKTLVYVNVWAIGRDPDSWENPEEFLPERFLNGNKEIDFRGQDFELLPFGSGRRICPGINMGLAIVELGLVNLVCLFDWSLPVGMEEEALDTSTSTGIALHKKLPLCLLAKNVHST